ncbi:uncharacterized protein BO95DRAFT_405119 [Aspergillus brunneoviolaceus CBS 621.78]|uniref:Uncharacterized protein n=1 Tax=Aspergillus brunneoviolaceus CBS 621.78 TaxID=1450534 RepID=A0ACD1GLU6_9EURO|nr:hypothetical protein BO95DRAFT_405119 [Aspergillus brunneoviolaceus CBS 621.78]RAH50107.1 hypothetical protein BO95DRAFT_405119 [Aspergillus brunneoviolaceus CBS 621.78]
MASYASYGLLDQLEEDGLHKSRLLNVEEKPFKRISKRLLNNDSVLVANTTLPPTPPPDGMDDDAAAADAAAAAEAEKQKRQEHWSHFREDVALDFAAFEISIARIQFLLTSNEKERERYATEKLGILDTMQSVRDNTSELRVQLEEAQRLLALRKSYDELADKITSNRLLKPREDQQANLQKLQAEITDLEKESKEYAQTWAERREQFGRIVEEGMQLRRLIRDEKEEVERREGMQEGEDGDDGDVPSKGKSSGANTPRHDSESLASSHQSPEELGRLSAGLQVDRSATTGAASPLRQVTVPGDEEKRSPDLDNTMEDEGEVQEELEEGEEQDDRTDRMDTT